MSGTQVDARIPLTAGPAQNVGPNLGVMLQGAAQMDALRAEQQKEQRQNMLRGILGKEGTIDEHGMVTPDALRQIGGVDPEAAMKISQNNLVTQQRRMQYDTLRSDAYFKQAGYLNDQYAPILQQYEEGVKKGEVPEPVLRKQAEEAVQETTKRVREGGFVGPEVGRTLPDGFDPVEMKRRAMQSEEYRKWAIEQRRREEDAAKNKRDDEKEKRQGWVTMDDLGKKDEQGNPTQYRYNPGTGEATSLDGKAPYAPVRGAKVGTEKTAPPGSLASRMVAIQSDVDNDAQWKDKPAGERAAEAIRRYEVAKGEANAIPDETARTIAEQALAGDWSGTVGMGRDAASRRKIANKISEVGRERGMTGADIAAKRAEFQGITAAERVLGTRGAGIDLGIAEAQKFAPMVLELSEKIDRTQFPTVNSLLLASERGTGGEDVVRMIDALNAYKMAYTQILTRGGMPTDDARKRADEIINIAWSKGQIRASVDQLGKEMVAARSAVPEVRANLWNAITGKPAAEYPGIPKETQQQGAGAPAVKGTGGAWKGIPIPVSAIEDLNKNPNAASAFDQHFESPGLAASILGTKVAAPTQAPLAAAPPAPVGSTSPNAPVQTPPAAAPAQAGPRAAPPAAPAGTPPVTYTPTEKQKNDPEGTVYKDGTGQNFIMRGNRIVALPSDDPARDVLRAKEAIRLGAPKDKVIKMLKGAGITDEMIEKAGLDEPKKKVIQQEEVGDSDRVQREDVGADGKTKEPGMFSRLFSRSPEGPEVIYGNRLREYPGREHVDAARAADFSYGTGNEAFMSGQRQRELPGGVDGGETLSEVANPKAGRSAAGTPETGDLYTKAQLAILRSPISALGYEPRKVNLDTKSGKTNVAGAYDPDTDGTYSNATAASNMVHEATHRGLERLRKAGVVPKELWDRLPSKEEDIVRYIMALHMGDPEKGRGKVADEQRANALLRFGRDMKDPQQYDSGASSWAKKYRSALNELTDIAAKYFGSLHPGGPR